MGFNEEAADALEALAWHEAAIAEFYKESAALFEKHAPLFSKIADEESNHSAMLLEAKDLTKNAEVSLFATEAVNLALVESSTKYVRKEIERLKSKEGILLADVLAIATKIENSFFERNIFDAFKDSPSVKLRETARVLSAETSNHAKELGKLILEAKTPSAAKEEDADEAPEAPAPPRNPEEKAAPEGKKSASQGPNKAKH